LELRNSPIYINNKTWKTILKTGLVILITAESACILTAETVIYKYSILLSVPLALLAGAFTVVAPEAYRKTRTKQKNQRSTLH